MPDHQKISRYFSNSVAVVSVEAISQNIFELEDECECRGEIRVELHLAHFSVKEYLLSDRLDSDIARRFQEHYAGAAIAKYPPLTYCTRTKKFDRQIYSGVIPLQYTLRRTG